MEVDRDLILDVRRMLKRLGMEGGLVEKHPRSPLALLESSSLL